VARARRLVGVSRDIPRQLVNRVALHHIAGMTDRRTVLLAGASLLGIPFVSRHAAAQVTQQDSADLARVQAYLNGIRTLRAHFVQVAPDGAVTQGTTLLQRPGKMRFEYDPPSPFLLVANYGTLFFRDSQLGQTSNIPLGRTPLGMLLSDQITLSGEIAVTKLVRLPGQLQVSLVRTANPGEGTLTLHFADNPLALRQWIVLDAQGKQTRVTFTNMEVGVTVDAKAFDFRNM
jgi:outer membrane lipoprotein-sorting protein